MNSKLENNILTLFPEGTIDTNNAEAFGKEVSNIAEINPYEAMILDFDNINYISSAGLRQILKLKKANADFKIINVNSEVYDIFDMTGFSEMMTIEKAYRKLSIEGCEKIGEGSNGIVYRLNDDTIIKVYKNNDALEDIIRERELARKALVMGVNTAISYDVVKVGDKYGSVFEMVNSKSLTKWINSDHDNIAKYVQVFSDMLHEIHSTEVKADTLPSEKQVVLNWVTYLDGKIDKEHYDKLYRLIDAVPETNTLIHGDYHTGNCHYDQKECILIDMDTIAVGHPIFEFGSIYNAYIGYGLADKAKVTDFINISCEDAVYVWQNLVRDYFQIDDITDIENKAKVVGLTRVLRRTLKREPDNTALIEISRKELFDAIDKVDSLI